MWSGPGQDPGGSTDTSPPNAQELIDLKDQFEQQQLLIAQLKEMLRKTEQTTVTQEKVEEYASTLTKMKARAKRNSRKDGSKESAAKHIETPASVKINLLRQQLEENRAKMAERGKNQKGIEEMVTQLKAQLDDSQILMNNTPLNLSLVETKQETYSVHSSSQELYNILINKERRITEMSQRIQKLEANVLDLQENLKEKDSVIDARTKAITLMSENLSKKGKSTLDALDDTKLQMRKMQENFVELEMQMKEENQRLLNQVQQDEIEIANLKQRNAYLEQMQQELNTKNNELQEKLDNQANDNIEDQSNVDKSLHTPTEIEKLHTHIRELETLNAELQKSKDMFDNLENKGNSSIQEIEKLEKQLENNDKECNEYKIKLAETEKTVEEQQLQITEYITIINNLESKFTDNVIPETESNLANLDIKLENEEITKLKKQLDESNKNMIKVKAQHKSKIKELNKKIDTFKKMGDVNAQVVKLHEENSKLNQKLIELEEEKGALQLKIMETDSAKDSTGVEFLNELEKKVSDQAILLTEKDVNIDELTKRLQESSAQIGDLNEKLIKLTHLQNVQVKSEITSIQLEEQVDKLELGKQELIKEKEVILQENLFLTEKLEILKKEKQEILSKLESYMQENIDLVDKLEKLSAEKVSSAESIEIVENLTQQEKLELEAYQKNANITNDIKTSTEHLEENPELNESVNQLTEETSELLQKIELFTIERREVMEKMEQLTQENNQLNLRLKEIENNRDVLAETYEQLQNEKEQLDSNFEDLKAQTNTLQEKIKELECENEKLKKLVEEDINRTDDKDINDPSIENMLKEIEEYKSFIEIQKQEIKELKIHLIGQDFINTDKLELEAKVSSLQLQYENVLTENDSLINKLKEQSEHVRQKEEIEEEVILARKRINEFEEKIAENLREIESYKLVLDENKTELVTSTNLINELRNNISALKNEVAHYNNEVTHLSSIIVDLNAAISHLENENKENSKSVENVNIMTQQLDDLKRILTQNIEEINEYQKELENNSITIIELQKEIKSLNIKILETEHLLESRNDELKVLKKEKEEKDSLIQRLNEDLRIKDGNFHQTINNLKEKYLNLQRQLETNSGSIDSIRQPLENKIRELENKKKEQLEKMKIIAANLKKKTQALQNLEQKFIEANEKWETEQIEKETLKAIAEKNIILENEIKILNEKLNSSHNDMMMQSTECQKVKEELSDYQQKFTSLENVNTKLSEEVSWFTVKLVDAQNAIKECEKKISELTSENELIKSDQHNNINIEINKKEIIIKNLSEQLENLRYTSETNSNALHMKIQEMEMFIETQDSDLLKYKERVNKLEEGLSFMEERRMSLERKAQDLGTQLEEKTNEYEEVSQTEDILEKRLNALIAHDEIIENKLQEMTCENEDLNKHLKMLHAENADLNEKYKQMKNLLDTMQAEKESSSMLENEFIVLQKTVTTLENDKKNMKNEYEQKFLNSKEDNEKMEVELQNQLELFDKDRKNFAEKNEIMSEQIKEYINNQEILNLEIASYKLKLEEQNKILLNNTEEHDKLQQEFQQRVFELNEIKQINKNNENTILKLNEQILNNNKDLEKLEQLQKDLQQKDVELEDYQKRNIKLDVQDIESQPKQFDFTSSFCIENDSHNLKQIIEDLRVQINTLQKEKESLNRALIETQQHLEEIKTQNYAIKEEPLKSDELKSLKAQYNNLEMNHGKLLEENFSLKNKIAGLTSELHQSHGSHTENKSLDVSTFTWPNEEQEIVQTKMPIFEVLSVESIDSTNKQLLEKIKYLENILRQTEKQKEDAVTQCSILSAKLLHIHHNQPDNIEKDVSQPQKIQFDFESQIVAPGNTKITSTDLAQLREYEYSPCKDITDYQSSSKFPIMEDIIVPKSSYLCYDPEDGEPSKSFDTYEENDDGWGWGPEEGKLEQEHFERTSTSPQNSQFMNQINLLEEKIRVLEQARERHLEEIKQSQLKSGKLIKKLKEFKTKNEELALQLNKKSDGFDDLNDTIQEELKSQIKNLEKKVKDINTELEKEKQEKGQLIKRVDILTGANERMIENKEKQDVEIMSWQQRYRELNSKLEQFEWGYGSSDSPKHNQNINTTETKIDANLQVQELTDIIKDLTLDNEELQALLEEQRNLRIAAEKLKSVEPIATNMKTEKEYLLLSDERNSLQKDLDLTKKELFKLKEDHSKHLQLNEDIQKEIKVLSVENQRLIEEIKNLNQSQLKEDTMQQINMLNIEKQQLIDNTLKNTCIIEDLRSKLNHLQSSYDSLVNNESTILELNKTITLLNGQVDSLSLENSALQAKLNDVEKDKENLLIDNTQTNFEKNELNNIISELNVKISNMECQLQSIQNLNSEFTEMKELLIKKDEELSALKEKFSQQEKEYEFKLSKTVELLSEEWAEKVDQRGFDIAESWKLHVEARENEFIQIEQQLRKEINDLEEKYTTLVNENNELRKNVDAEIRNEVDRVSALQQQINERQHEINDLSKMVQDQQAEIENKKIDIINLNSSTVELNKQLEEKSHEINNYEILINNKDDLIKDFKEMDATHQIEKEKTLELESEVENLKQTLSFKDNEIQVRDDKITHNIQELEKLKNMCNSLTTDIKEKTNIIDDLTGKIHNCESQEQVYNEKINILNQQINECQQQISNYHVQLQQQYIQIETLNQEILKYNMIHEQFSQKETELNKLTNLLQEREREYSINLDSKVQENMVKIKEQLTELDKLKRRLADSENQYEEILSAKDVDMQSLRIQLDEQIKRNELFLTEKEDFVHVQTELAIKTAEYEDMKTKLQEQNLLMEEESKQLCELREIIQDQVLKIEDLQKELFEKSKHYDALIAEVDISRKSEKNEKSAKHVKFSDEVENPNVSTSLQEDDLSEPVSRAELDLALYMLHQRDVRCEELTVELMQLLEERDTLQLKLSNALREKEVLKTKYDKSSEESSEKGHSNIPATSTAISAVPDSDDQLKQELTKLRNTDPLVSKLSELRTVGYHKDKTIVDEQEIRRLQQFSIMQQHRDEAAKLPPEAAARLVDASYTLSRDVQSPSKVLLNWLWGRSTPKVNNV